LLRKCIQIYTYSVWKHNIILLIDFYLFQLIIYSDGGKFISFKNILSILLKIKEREQKIKRNKLLFVYYKRKW
jgi:hypothetical protein